MAKQSFVTGQVLTAAQMTSLQQTAMLGGAASAKTASYTLVAADAGGAISMSNASATTITVNTALFSAGDTVHITNLGAGVCTITAGTATVNSSASLALAQYESGFLDFTSTSAAIFVKGAGAAGATGESYSLINAGGTAMSGSSTVTVSSISGMNSLMFFVDGADANSAVQIRLRLNADTGSNYFSNTVIFANPASYSTDSLSSGTNSGTSVNLLYTNNSDGRFIAVGGIVRGCNSAGIKSITFNGVCDGAGASAQIGTGRYEGTSTISSLSILASAGNFTGGTLYVYGSA